MVIDLKEVRARAIHLIHKRQTGNLILVCLTPYGFRLRLNAANGTVHHASSIQHAHRTLYFNREVDVPWGINNVNTVLWKITSHTLPERGGRSRSNRDTTLLLLLHPVHGCCTIMHFTNFVINAGVEQNAFCGCCLACVNVRRNTDIAVFVDGGFTCHGWYLFFTVRLEAEMRECFVGFCHTVHFFTLLHCAATAFSRF